MGATAGGPLAHQVAASAERSVEVLLARASVLGLPKSKSRALEYRCGVGTRTAALARSFETAVGIDPSPASIESAALMHSDRPRCAFITGGLEAVDELDGKVDFAYADLRDTEGADACKAVADALLRALAPGGMMVLSLPPLRRRSRLVGLARPSRQGWHGARAAVVASGGRIAWIGRGERGSVLLYAVAATRTLRLVRGLADGDFSNEG